MNASSNSWRLSWAAVLLALATISNASVAAAQATTRSVSPGGREIIPTPPGGGSGTSSLPADNMDLDVGDGSEGYGPDPDLLDVALQNLQAQMGDRVHRLEPIERDAQRYMDPIGGDDVSVRWHPDVFRCDIDIATNGDIYVAVELQQEDDDHIEVYRSQDGGYSWHSWGAFDAPGAASYSSPSIHVAEGWSNRCFVACEARDASYLTSIVVFRSPLSSTSGTWTEMTVMPYVDGSYYLPDITSDSAAFDPYFLYLVAQERDGNGDDIHFARSTDQGTSFESPYEIGSISSGGDHRYWSPEVVYGFGGYVHVTWFYRHDAAEFDSAVRYRRASNYAGGGLTAWDPVKMMTSTSNDVWDSDPRIAASSVSGEVVLVHERRRLLDDSWWIGDLRIHYSEDYGASFSVTDTIPMSLSYLTSLEYQPSTEDWILGGAENLSPAIQRISGDDPLSWGPPETFDDVYRPSNLRVCPVALDPSRADRIAQIWTVHSVPDPDNNRIYFDAEWCGDPGYPNHAEGFPLDLDHTPNSPPAVVDLDGDGDLEILYTDDERGVHAWHHDGTVVAGWPLSLSQYLSGGPVAIGDLDGSGEMSVVIGTSAGLVAAYDAAGQILPGWPLNTGSGRNAYVSIGELGQPGGTIVIASGSRTTFADKYGQEPLGSFPRGHTLRYHEAPCAIGDVDGDGVSEVVCGPADMLFAVRAFSNSTVLFAYLDAQTSDAITLGDLDLDGDVEVLVPTVDGALHAFDAGGPYPGTSWPFVSPTGSELTSAAIAQNLGNSYPEIAVAARDWTVHVLDGDGEETPWFPTETSDFWYIYGAPIMGHIAERPGVIVGARDDQLWSWNNFGDLNAGWPKAMDSKVNVSPAMGDVDEDGLAEVVVVTENQLTVIDLNEPLASVDRNWPMYGYDPERTGCARCPDVAPSSVEEEAGTSARAYFRVPSPVTLADGVRFEFALEERALVALELFDVHGRRIDVVARAEFEAGEHAVLWEDARNASRTVPPGVYFGRLEVQGPGTRGVMSRKLVLLP